MRDKGIAGIANPHSTTHKVCLETESLYSQKDRWVMFATEKWQASNYSMKIGDLPLPFVSHV